MTSIFSGCSSLNSLRDYSKWNTDKVTDISNMFSFCRSLKRLTYISKCNKKSYKYK